MRSQNTAVMTRRSSATELLDPVVSSGDPQLPQNLNPPGDSAPQEEHVVIGGGYARIGSAAQRFSPCAWIVFMGRKRRG
jgi:hypothetical protein